MLSGEAWVYRSALRRSGSIHKKSPRCKCRAPDIRAFLSFCKKFFKIQFLVLTVSSVMVAAAPKARGNRHRSRDLNEAPALARDSFVALCHDGRRDKRSVVPFVQSKIDQVKSDAFSSGNQDGSNAKSCGLGEPVFAAAVAGILG